jgi:hypothetical protein
MITYYEFGMDCIGCFYTYSKFVLRKFFHFLRSFLQIHRTQFNSTNILYLHKKNCYISSVQTRNTKSVNKVIKIRYMLNQLEIQNQ